MDLGLLLLFVGIVIAMLTAFGVVVYIQCAGLVEWRRYATRLEKEQEYRRSFLSKARRFIEMFYFEPALTPEGIMAQQYYVDFRLASLAQIFQRFCLEQERLTAMLRPDLSARVEDVRNTLSEAISVEAKLEHAKRSFWNAHEAAKMAGFAVKEKYTDYLPA